MNESRQGWIEQSGGGQTNSNHIDGDRTGKILPDDAPCPARDRQGFGELQQVIAEQHHIGAFARNVGS